MSLPESQLETWSHQGAVVTAKSTHELIRKALKEYEPLKKWSFDVFLQGSYKNDTNTRGDSDVDVVARLDSSFVSNTSSLSDYEKSLYKSAFSDASYTWQNFRADVLAALRTYFGFSEVDDTGNKSLKIKAGPNRLKADVIPCLQYRRYAYFRNISDQKYADGIVFYTMRERREVVNFPISHYDNGVAKNNQSATNGWYKPVVRVFKNMRKHLVEKQMLEKDVAPSYFVECLLYNVPSSLFGQSFQQSVAHTLRWLSTAELSKFTCQNERGPLFGPTPEQWSEEKARRLMIALMKL